MRKNDTLAWAVLCDLNKTVAFSPATLARGVFYEVDSEMLSAYVTNGEEWAVRQALERLSKDGLAREAKPMEWVSTENGERSCNKKFKTADALPALPLLRRTFGI